MSLTRKELDPKSWHWQSQAEGDTLVGGNPEASALRGPPGNILTFLPWASEMLCRDTSSNSPSSRMPSPLRERENEGVTGSVVLRKEPQVQWPHLQGVTVTRASVFTSAK